MRKTVIAVLFSTLAELSCAEPCSIPLPDQCASVGCVNNDIRACESEADLKRINKTPAGQENIDICLRRIVKNESAELTVDSVLAAVLTCQNKDAFES